MTMMHQMFLFLTIRQLWRSIVMHMLDVYDATGRNALDPERLYIFSSFSLQMSVYVLNVFRSCTRTIVYLIFILISYLKERYKMKRKTGRI